MVKRINKEMSLKDTWLLKYESFRFLVSLWKDVFSSIPSKVYWPVLMAHKTISFPRIKRFSWKLFGKCQRKTIFLAYLMDKLIANVLWIIFRWLLLATDYWFPAKGRKTASILEKKEEKHTHTHSHWKKWLGRSLRVSHAKICVIFWKIA